MVSGVGGGEIDSTDAETAGVTADAETLAGDGGSVRGTTGWGVSHVQARRHATGHEIRVETVPKDIAVTSSSRDNDVNDDEKIDMPRTVSQSHLKLR